MPEPKKTVIIAPHSHIDVEWYWTYDQAIAWTKETVRLALDMMRRDPRYHFALDQVELLRPTLEAMPADVRGYFVEMVRADRLQVVGDMFVQPEVAEPRGESLVRQTLIGRDWLRRELGTVSDLGWFIDTFGQMSQVPQILARSGMKYYAFGRDVPFELGPEGVPADFWYASPDGSRVLTHLMPAHYSASHDHGGRGLATVLRRSHTPYALFPWGGDVYFPDCDSAAMIAQVRAWAEDLGLMDDIAAIRVGGPLDYFRAVEQYGVSLPVLRDDFSQPYHVQDLRGCFDNRIELKKLSRQAEEALLEAETVGAIASARGCTYQKTALDALWRALLHQHFHDIIAGSHHDPVYRSAMAACGEVLATARSLTAEALLGAASAAEPSTDDCVAIVYNSLSQERTDLARLPMPAEGEHHIQDECGASVACRQIEGESGRQLEFVANSVPGLGARTYRVVGGSAASLPRSPARSGPGWAENDWLHVAWRTETGDLTEVVDRVSGHNLIDSQAGPANEVIAIRELLPDMEGNIHVTAESYRSTAYGAVAVEAESSAIHDGLLVRRPFRDCSLSQRLLLYHDLPRLDLETIIEDFHGGDMLIKASFPLAIDWGKAHIDYDTPFAVTARRRGHYGAQNWVDCSDGERGLALLNTGEAGYYVGGGRLELVLLRSFADYRGYQARGRGRGLAEFTDSTQTEMAREHGTHRSLYSLVAHRGRWRDAGLVAAGMSLNRPLVCLAANAAAAAFATAPWLEVSGDFALSAVKQAEQAGGLVVRGWETAGRQGQVSLRLPGWARSVTRADLMENCLTALEIEDNRVWLEVSPHEVVTIIMQP